MDYHDDAPSGWAPPESRLRIGATWWMKNQPNFPYFSYT